MYDTATIRSKPIEGTSKDSALTGKMGTFRYDGKQIAGSARLTIHRYLTVWADQLTAPDELCSNHSRPPGCQEGGDSRWKTELAWHRKSPTRRKPCRSSQIMFMDRDDILNLYVVTNLPLPAGALPAAPSLVDDDVPF